MDDKGKPERARQCFEACKALHEQSLGEVDSDAARAVVAFFASGSRGAGSIPRWRSLLEEILSGGNLVFRTEAERTKIPPCAGPGRHITTQWEMDRRASAW